MEGIRPCADLRNHYNEIAEECRRTREAIFITKNGREDTVIMGSADYRRMKAELELLEMLAESEADMREGRVMPWDEGIRDLKEKLMARKKP